VTGQLLRFSRYRFRRTFRHRWGAYLPIVLLIGLAGGLSMGALAAARRTESSFPTFLASTNPSNLSLGTALWNPALGYTTGYNGPSWPPSPACLTSGGPRATPVSTARQSERAGR
jgi:hypothetical protein